MRSVVIASIGRFVVSAEESIYLPPGNGATPGNYRRLRAWNEAMDLVMGVYRLTRRFPEHELEGMTLQIRQAAVTVPAKIANGSGRFETDEFLEQIAIAASSLTQVEALLQLALRLEYAAPDDVISLIDQCAEVGRQLDALRRYLEERI
jgi:four helix bundle protein